MGPAITNSGAAVKTVGIIIAGILGFFVLLIVVGAIIGTVADPEPQQTAQHEAPAKRDMLAVLCNIVDESRELYEKAGKAAPLERDEARSRAVENRASAMQREFADGSVEHWKVTLDDIFQDDKARSVSLEMKLPCDATLKTSSDHAIQTNSPLYSVLKTLRRGDKITVSGQFIIDHKDDFFNEMSLTQSGSMDEPEYLFRVTTINGIQEPTTHDAASDERESEVVVLPDMNQFLKEVAAMTPKMTLEVDPDNYLKGLVFVRIMYGTRPSTQTAKNEAITVTKNALKVLMSHGIVPHRDEILLNVFNYVKVVGVTGKDNSRMIGMADYDYEKDDVGWGPGTD